MVEIYAPVQRPEPPLREQLHILFLHPSYDDNNNVLFKLHAPDTDQNGQPGLFAQFAIDACAVIAGDCAGRGWLSLSRDGSDPVEATSTLCKDSYYFHLSDVDSPYAIVPSFRQWSYPHGRLPPHWQQLQYVSDTVSASVNLTTSNLTTAVFIRDRSCRLSGCRDELQVAHLVPDAELDWWEANGMSRYNTGSAATLDDTANALLLRADLHITFDSPSVVFVPKPATDGSMRLVAHALEHSPELEHLYHNHELHPTAVGINMLYARFAWSIFTLLDTFLESKVDRRLALRTTDTGLGDAWGFVTAANCELFSTAASRKRSISEDPPLPLPRAPTDSSVSPPRHGSSRPLPAPSLAQSWLENERQRSDPDGTWDKEREWAQEVWNGRTLTGDEIERWFAVNGIEMRDV